MKKRIFAVVLMTGIAIGAIAASHTEDPEIKAVKASFPEAKNIHKINKAEGYTEFDFQIDHKNIAAIYNKEGKLVETDYEISYSEVPASVRTTIADNFTKMEVTKVTKISYSKNTFYKITLISESKQFNIAADNDGEVTILLE